MRPSSTTLTASATPVSFGCFAGSVALAPRSQPRKSDSARRGDLAMPRPSREIPAPAGQLWHRAHADREPDVSEAGKLFPEEGVEPRAPDVGGREAGSSGEEGGFRPLIEAATFPADCLAAGLPPQPVPRSPL